MTAWKGRVEKGFGALAHNLYDHPLRALLLLLLVIGVMATQLRHIYFDTSTEGFLSPQHPAIQAYDQFREEFGRDELVIVGAVTDDVLTPAFANRFKALFEAVDKGLPATESVDSLLNARYVHGADDELMVEDLFEPWPESEDDFQEILRRINSNNLYRGLFISRDQTMATIVIRLHYIQPDETLDPRKAQALADAQTAAFLQTLNAILDQHRSDDMQLYVAGSPVVTDLLRTSMMSDMRTFSLWVIAAIAVLLFVLFRRIFAVVFPLIVVILSDLLTVSLMGLFHQPLQLPTAMLPSFLMVVGIGDSIHFLSLFFSEFNRTGDKRSAIVHALEHSGLAMFLTSLTTAAGMASFSNADLLPISNLGVFTAAGVMFAFLISIIVLPTALRLLPIKPKPLGTSPHTAPLLNRLIDGATHISFHYPKSVVFSCITLFAASAVLVSQMEFSHNPLKWLPDDMPAKQSIQTIDRELGGSISLEIVVDTGQETGIYDPGFLRKLEQLCAELGAVSTPEFKVNKVLSITDLIKESNRALHDNDEAYYRIPDDRALVAQELFLLELSGSEDLFRLVNREYSKARITLTLPWINALLYAPLMDTLEQRFHDHLGPGYSVTITGLIPLLGSTLNSVIHSAAQAYVIAIIVISLIMIVLLGNFKLGLISMFPNILPIAMVIALMQLNGVPFDMFTILIGSIAIGLCVDDTVHFMHHFGRYRERGCDTKEAISRTLHSAGRAMLVTSIVLCSGFLVLTLSELNNFTHFGVYSALCIMLALLADFLLAPALMTLLNPVRLQSTPDAPSDDSPTATLNRNN
ncbi:MAG: MMPL family transporter [Ketobacter sp.]|nr:MMPL family transporter [Ketobacter sp.]